MGAVVHALIPPLRFDAQYPAHADISLFRGDDLVLDYAIDDGGSPPGPKDLTNWQQIWWVFGDSYDNPFLSPLIEANVPDAPLAGVTIDVPFPSSSGIIRVDVEPAFFQPLQAGWYGVGLKVRDANSRERVSARGAVLLI